MDLRNHHKASCCCQGQADHWSKLHLAVLDLATFVRRWRRAFWSSHRQYKRKHTYRPPYSTRSLSALWSSPVDRRTCPWKSIVWSTGQTSWPTTQCHPSCIRLSRESINSSRSWKQSDTTLLHSATSTSCWIMWYSCEIASSASWWFDCLVCRGSGSRRRHLCQTSWTSSASHRYH